MNENYVHSSQPVSGPDPAPSSVQVPPQVPEVPAEAPQSDSLAQQEGVQRRHDTARDNLRASSGVVNPALGVINSPVLSSFTAVGQGPTCSTSSPQESSQHNTTAVDACLGNV